MRRVVELPLVVATVCVLCGCATYVRDVTWTPPGRSLGKARKLVLVEATGRRSIREEVVVAVREQARTSLWWRFEDRQERGVSIDLAGGTPRAKPVTPADGEVFLRLDLYDWETRYDTRETKVSEVEEVDGKEVTREVQREERFLLGEISFGVTTVAADGVSELVEKEYTGDAERLESYSAEKEAMKEAIEEAVRVFLDDITPRRRNVSVRFDDESEDMKCIGELVKSRAYAQALRDLEAVHASQPDRADVIYNMGAVLQGMGDYEHALDRYTQAIQLGAKPYYHNTRTSCVNSLRNRQQLGE